MLLLSYLLPPPLPTYTHVHTFTCRFPSLKVEVDSQLAALLKYKDEVKPLLCDTIYFMNNAIKEQKKIIVEGANATMLDIDFGKAWHLR